MGKYVSPAGQLMLILFAKKDNSPVRIMWRRSPPGCLRADDGARGSPVAGRGGVRDWPKPHSRPGRSKGQRSGRQEQFDGFTAQARRPYLQLLLGILQATAVFQTEVLLVQRRGYHQVPLEVTDNATPNDIGA